MMQNPSKATLRDYPPAAGVLTFEESKLLRSLVDYHERPLDQDV